MYAGTGIMSPYLQNLPFDEFQQFNDGKTNASSLGLIQTSTISDYNLGGDGDLFKAPEPVIQEPLMSLDPMEAAISMISCGEDVIPTQSLTMSDIESSIECGQLLSEVFYECRKDLLAKEGNETPISEMFTINIPNEETLFAESQFQKSVSSSCLKSMDFDQKAQLRPNFLDFPAVNLDGGYCMRRAFSEGDIKTLGNGTTNVDQSSLSPKGPSQRTSGCISEDRKEKLSRYRNKRAKRNFGRKIKYACRKALADNQPRIRGRFAKT